MSPEKFKRKLTAILSADVKGYSRLMGEDEEATLRTLQGYKEVMASSIQHHRGRIVGTAGDSVLAEFASVVDAVQCAVEIQQVLRAKNSLLPEDRRMDFRIGINLGDVIEEGDTIYGDGVNIAARLESIAEAGGICISGSAYEQIENKLPLHYDYLGEHEVKNIAKPVRVYRARIEAEVTEQEKGPGRKEKGKRPLALNVLAAFGVMAAVVVLWQFVLRPAAPPRELASKEKMAFPLPDLPSIAVLPFVNMSEDPKQEFLSDGITESIITALSRIPRLFVIARNSTFTYKGKPAKVKQVSEELGVRYVLEGSVQRSADRVRITAQLIDALTGNHIWAERYDHDLKDLFALQDEITTKILGAVRVELTEGGPISLSVEKYYRGKQGLDCYLKIMEGYKYQELFTFEDNERARRIAEEAVAMCPEVPRAYQLLATVNTNEYFLGSSKSFEGSIAKAFELAQKSLAMDDTQGWVHGYLSYLYCLKREYEKAIAEAERGVALNPSLESAYYFYGVALFIVGRSQEAIPVLPKVIRLNPHCRAERYWALGIAYLLTGRYEEAISAYKKALQRSPNSIIPHVYLAITYSMMVREKEARAEAAEVLRINPKYSLESFKKRQISKDQSVTDTFCDALRKAGLK